MKYYILHTEGMETLFNDRYWFLIEGPEGLYVKYYIEGNSSIIDIPVNRGKKHILISGDRMRALRGRAKEVTKKEWEEEMFLTGI